MELDTDIGNIREPSLRQDQINPILGPHPVALKALVGPILNLTGPIRFRRGQGTLVDVLLAVGIETVVFDFFAVSLDSVDGGWSTEPLALVGQDAE